MRDLIRAASACLQLAAVLLPLAAWAQAPVITRQPQNQIIGGTYSLASPLTANITGSSPLGLQWFKDGIPLPGATQPMYWLQTVQPSQAGTYTLRVTNAFGTALSSNAFVFVGIPYHFTNQAGLAGTLGSADGTNSTARFKLPAGVAVDAQGNVFVADNGNHTIRRVTAAGVVTTLAGSPGLAGIADGTNTSARFNTPFGITVDAGGNLYVADTGNHAIRKVTADGVVTTIAGLPGTSGSADGSKEAARFTSPFGLAVEPGGNLYVADTGNHTLRLVTPDGRVTTLAGLAGAADWADGTNDTARFSSPRGVAVDSSGAVYIADFNNNRIRRMVAGGIVTTLAGATTSGSVDGSAQTGRFNQPSAVAVDAGGNVFVADSGNGLIRQLMPDGTVISVAGGGYYMNSVGSATRFAGPLGIAVDAAGFLYVGDTGQHLVQKGWPGTFITSQPQSQAVMAGSNVTFTPKATSPWPLSCQWRVNGTNLPGATNLTLSLDNVQTNDAGLYSLAVSNAVDSAISSNATLSVLTLPPSISSHPQGGTVLVGSNITFTATAIGSAPLVYQWLKNGTNLPGATTNSYRLASVRMSDAGVYNLLVSNAAGLTALSSNAPLTVLPAMITQQPPSFTVAAGYQARFTVAATGPAPLSYLWLKDGNFLANTTSGLFILPSAQYDDAGTYTVVVSNASGTITSSNAALTVIPPYTFSTYAGVAGSSGTNDGPADTARFSGPSGMAVDGAGTVYVSDFLANNIRKITLDGTVSTLAGLAGASGTNDGVGTEARFRYPEGLALDAATNLYVADNGNSRVRKIAPDGTVSTVATAIPASAVVLDSAGNIYTAEWSPNRISKLTPAGQASVFAGGPNGTGWTDGIGTNASFQGPDGIGIDAAGNLYVTDQRNYLVRKITPDALVTTLAGSPSGAGALARDGVGADARLDYPYGGTADSAGNFFMAGFYDTVIRRITPGGVVTTLAGAPYSGGAMDGAGTAARFSGNGSRNGIAVDPAGNLFVADLGNRIIRKGVPFAVTTLPQSQAVPAGNPVTLTALATAGAGPFSYQWLFAGAPLPGQTNSSLQLDAVGRTNTGPYSVIISNQVGNCIKFSATVRALFPPSIQIAQLTNNASVRLLFQDADGGVPFDLSKITVQWRTNLPSGSDTNWQTMTAGLYLTNDFVALDDTNNILAPSRFYRILEQ